ncbi:undecaprenyl-diphosphate phosphatase [Caproiciproducens galactitolivorans]|uniref:Undecaprenyl-diphosphatase n=1 Tax=Caproiciproducens galactitolivorans TaxID=642589 RepID=A0ABT4BW61_9FIRM|nr:undecaprenyl-diphosphate phosphatase [Caproiciproducens galactitolivorans]MCY1714565.1 undecaprenyl-diphosphate phosphatase [Caproiciproducens galactitolivorans]
MTVLQAIIQGIIQGATEFLPVSSSGHLSLAQHFMGVQVPGLFFDVMLHIGTLLAVLAVYYRLVGRLICEFFLLIRDLFTGRFKWNKMNPDRRMLIMLIIGLVPLFLLFLPVPGTGMKLKDFADKWASDSDIVIEGASLIMTSILLTLGILAGNRSGARHAQYGRTGGRKQFNVPDAVTVGLVQCVAAVFPGLSRSGSTLSAGLMRGINRQTALDYSFVIGIPSILAAAVLELKDAVHEPTAISTAAILAGVIVSAIVGFMAIKLLRWMVTTNKLHIFAIYTFILGVTVLVLGIMEHHTGVNAITGAALHF